MGIISKTKSKCVSTVNTFMAKHPKQFNAVTALGVSAAITINNLIINVAADTTDATGKIQAGIKQMVSIATTVVMGIGIIMAIMAIFNWVSAMHEEDSSRQSKSIVRVIIAAILILIKPISKAIINAVDSNTATTYDDVWN